MKGLALDMNACKVERAVQLDGAHLDGELRVVAGRIGTYVRARHYGQRDARFVAPTPEAVQRYAESTDLDPLSGLAVFIERTTIGRDITFSAGTKVQGLAVRRSEVGDLRLDGALLCAAPAPSSPVPDHAHHAGVGLDATATKIGGFLELKQAEGSSGYINVSHASVERLDDRLPWRCEELDLDGFTYRAVVAGDPLTQVNDRLTWLRSQRTFSGQPYEQLALVYRNAGYPDQARTVLWRRDEDLRKKKRLSRPSWLASWIFGITVGHGYRLHRAAVGLLGLWLIGGGIFTLGWRWNGVDLAGREAGEARVLCPTGEPCFSPWWLSLDVVVPVVDVGQQGSWDPVGGVWQAWAVFQAAAGWALTTAAVAGYARKIQRQ